MAIKSIDILNVLIFQRQWRINNEAPQERNVQKDDVLTDGFRLDFCDGINVIIGENGVGKTSLLKMIYAATQWSNTHTNTGKTKDLLRYFSSDIADEEGLKSYNSEEGFSYYRVSDGIHKFEYSLSHKGIFNYDNWQGLNISSVMIPTTEMLSHSRSFLALNEKFNMPFDGTQVDIIVNASLPETRKIPENMQGILAKISKAIGGKIVFENDIFYVVKENGRKTEFSLEAEGLRKLGLLWKLIRNGVLEKDSILLWDEPEANLNPELYPLVVEILLELAKKGVQVFVATHSYNFAKYLEISREQREQVLFHNLYISSSELPENINWSLKNKEGRESGVCSQSAYRMEDLKPNHILIADDKLLEASYQQSIKEIDERIKEKDKLNE